jgi:hypothetical protein
MRTKVIWASLAILWAAAPVSAEECNKPLKLVSSLPMTDVASGDGVTIPVFINGVEKQFQLETGRYATQISPAVADQLKIPRHHAPPDALSLYDKSVPKEQVTIDEFNVGPLWMENYQIGVTSAEGLDGFFNPMVFNNFDFEMDFAAAKLNIFMSDHCEGHVFYWPHQASAAVPFTNLEVGDTMVGERFHVGLITVPATLDGKQVKAIIDTGTRTSSIGISSAMFTFGLRPDAPNMTMIGHIGNDENAPIFAYPFKTLTFGDITVNNPNIRILSGPIFSPGHQFPELRIGMDVLRKLHLYLAIKEGKLYITEASAPAAPAASANASK